MLTAKANAAASLVKETYEEIVKVAETGLTDADTTVFLAVFQKVSNNFTLYRSNAAKGNQ